VTVVPTLIFSICGLNAKEPVLSTVIVTVTVVAGRVGVGVGVGGTGVGVGFETVGVVPVLDNVGVGVGRDVVGVGADGVVVPTIVVLAVAGAGVIVAVAVVVLLSPPQAVNTTNSAAIKRLNQAMCLDTYVFLSMHKYLFPLAMTGKMRGISSRTHLLSNTVACYTDKWGCGTLRKGVKRGIQGTSHPLDPRFFSSGAHEM
jgi:hypothetical protein